MDEIPLHEEILRLLHARLPAALVTIVEARGSTPRRVGAKMLVRADGSIMGTIGGGKWEADAIATALEAVRCGYLMTRRYSLTENHGAACGGAFMVAIDPLVIPARLIIFGSGHVGKAVAEAAAKTGFTSQVIDVREAIINNQVDAAHALPDGRFFDHLMNSLAVDAMSFLFIATSDHQTDFQAVAAALTTPARYIGLLGSRKKRQALETFLQGKGFVGKDLERVRSPAGIAIGAEGPEEIAVSVVAELIAERRKK